MTGVGRRRPVRRPVQWRCHGTLDREVVKEVERGWILGVGRKRVQQDSLTH